MKIKLLSILITIPFLIGVSDTVQAAGEWQELPTNGDGTLKNIPENTQCREMDFYNDEKRTDINGEPFYDLCIGSYPKFPSTSIEEGTSPFYYLKYYFFPEPMPLYDVENSDITVGNSVIKGLNQNVVMAAEDLEAYDYPLNETNKDLFLHYPYDKGHADSFPVNTTILGPYQVGYNSFYHNTYRSRYFAEEVVFEFFVLEPKMNNVVSNPSDSSDIYMDKEILFTGEIIYDLYDPSNPNECFREDVLDYTDECRSIEFYFPTSKNHAAPPAPYSDDEIYAKAEVTKENGIDAKAKNTIWAERYPYKNPGTHKLVVNVIENTQLRYQKDIGGEFQRDSREVAASNGPSQGAGDFNRAQKGEVYFARQDVDTGYQVLDKDTVIVNKNTPYVPPAGYEIYKAERLFTSSVHTQTKYYISKRTVAVTPRNEIVGEPTFPGTTATSVGLPILKKVDGHWVYDPEINESYTNYCDVDTGTFGSDNYKYRFMNVGPAMNVEQQMNSACYHNNNKEYHYWKYYWSKPQWYADDPSIY